MSLCSEYEAGGDRLALNTKQDWLMQDQIDEKRLTYRRGVQTRPRTSG
jgi:hypothetical protein